MSDVPSLRLLAAFAAVRSGVPAALLVAPEIPADLAAYVGGVRQWAAFAVRIQWLPAAARCGNLEAVRWAFRLSGVMYSEQAEAFLSAARSGRVDVARWIAEAAPDVAAQQVSKALRGAAAEGHASVVLWLLEAYEDHLWLSARLRALDLAIDCGHMAVMKHLVAAWPPNILFATMIGVGRGKMIVPDYVEHKRRAAEWLLSPASGLVWHARALREAIERTCYWHTESQIEKSEPVLTLLRAHLRAMEGKRPVKRRRRAIDGKVQ